MQIQSLLITLLLLTGVLGCKPKDQVPVEPFVVQGVSDMELRGGRSYCIINLKEGSTLAATDTVSLSVSGIPKGVEALLAPSSYLTTMSGSTSIVLNSSDSSVQGTYNLTLHASSKSGYSRLYDFKATVLPFNGYKIGSIVQNCGGRASGNTYYLTYYSSRTGHLDFMFTQPGAPAPGVYKIVNYNALANNDEVVVREQSAEPVGGGLWVSSGKDKQTLTIAVKDGKYTVTVPPTDMMAGPGYNTTLTAKLTDY